MAFLVVAAAAVSLAVPVYAVEIGGGPTWDHIDADKDGTYSVTSYTTSTSSNGDVYGYAYKDSGNSYAQAQFEYGNELEVGDDDDNLLTVYVYADLNSRYLNPQSASGHVVVFPLVHKTSDGVGTTIAECHKPSFTEYTTNSSTETAVFSSVVCQDIPANEDYYISAYVHVRADPATNGNYASADVDEIDVLYYWYE